MLTIILPVYNEEKTVDEALKRLIPLPIDKEIVIVNDGSTDKTLEMIEKYRDNGMVTIISHERNKGKGAAIRTGIDKARGEKLIIQDADLEQEPKDIIKLMEFMEQKGLKAVFGTRILNWGFDSFDIRYIANMLFALITNTLFKSHLSDIMTGYKLFDTSLIKSLNLQCNSFDIEPEMTAKTLKREITIGECPISYSPRTYEEGKKIRFKDSFKIVYRLIIERLSK